MASDAWATNVLLAISSALLSFSVLRVSGLLIRGDEVAFEVWRRRWAEVGWVISVGVALLLIGAWIG